MSERNVQVAAAGAEGPPKAKLYIRIQLSKDITGVTDDKLDHLLYWIHKVKLETSYS